MWGDIARRCAGIYTLIYDMAFLLKKKKKKIITVNPPEVRPVFTLPTRGLKFYILPTWT